MKILHFIDQFSQPTQTFIKRYIQKSIQFADAAVASFQLCDIPDDIQHNVTLYKIEDEPYSRKNLPGIKRYVTEKVSGKKLWYYRFNEIIETFKPDIIHCHFGTMGVLMMEYNNQFKSKIPFVTSFYGYDISSKPFLDKNYREKLPELWKAGDAFFAEGPALVKKLTDAGCLPDKCFVNPLLIPVDEYPHKEVYRNPGEPVKFIFIGRFAEKKGLHLFLEAVGSLKHKIGEFTVTIVGEGPYQPIYEAIIDQYNLQQNIIWSGLKKHADVIEMMKLYDFLVHPSLTAKDSDSEGGAPTIILEAQAVGLPVITSNHADIPFVMGYHDFIAIENDLDSLVEAIEKIINCNHISDYTKQGIEKVKSLHDLQSNTLYETNLRKALNV